MNEKCLSLKDAQSTYEELMRILIDIKDIPFEKVKQKISLFINNAISSQILVDYMYKLFSHNISDHSVGNIFPLMFESPHNDYLFDAIINNYLGLENIKELLVNNISEEFYEYINFETFKITQKHDFLKNAKLKYGYPQQTFYDFLAIEFFDEIKENNLLNSAEIKEIVENFFRTRVEDSNGTSIAKKYQYLIYEKNDWFKAKRSERDIISVLISCGVKRFNNVKTISAGVDESVFILTDYLKKYDKSGALHNYISNREENIIIEYMAKQEPFIDKETFNFLAEKFPDLLKAKSEKGILDIVFSEFDFMDGRDAVFLDICRELPLNLLFSSDSKNILNLSKKMPAMKEVFNLSYKSMSFYIEALEIAYDKLIKNKNKDIQEACKFLNLQREVISYIKQYKKCPPSEMSVNIKEIIEDKKSGLSKYKDLKEFVLIESLIEKGCFPEDYLHVKCAEEEKDILNKNIHVVDNKKSKKRI